MRTLGSVLIVLGAAGLLVSCVLGPMLGSSPLVGVGLMISGALMRIAANTDPTSRASPSTDISTTRRTQDTLLFAVGIATAAALAAAILRHL